MKLRKKTLASLRKKNKNRQLKACNFQTVKTLGVVMYYKFDVENNALTRLKQIIKENNIEAKMLVYYPQKKLPENMNSSPDKVIFSDKETSWIGKPKPVEVHNFIKEQFDMMIDMSSETCFTLEYIATASKARFKIGRVDYDENYEEKPYDFLLKDEENLDDLKFIKDLELYLTKFI